MFGRRKLPPEVLTLIAQAGRLISVAELVLLSRIQSGSGGSANGLAQTISSILNSVQPKPTPQSAGD